MMKVKADAVGYFLPADNHGDDEREQRKQQVFTARSVKDEQNQMIRTREKEQSGKKANPGLAPGVLLQKRLIRSEYRRTGKAPGRRVKVRNAKGDQMSASGWFFCRL